MNSMFVLFFVILIPVFISMMFIPYLTRKTESFGVSIPEKVYHSEKLKGMRKQYATITGLFSLLLIVVLWLLTKPYQTDENAMAIVFSICIFVYIIATFFIYLHFHRNMKKFKQQENWAKDKAQLVVIDTKFRNEKLTYSNAWFLLSFLIAIVTVCLTFYYYHRIPEQMPINYNFSGEVTRWATKSYRTVLALPMMQVYMILLFIFVNTMIAKAKQQVSAVNPEKSRRQNVAFRRRWSAFMIITGTALTTMFSIIQLNYFYSVNQQFFMVIPHVIGIGIIVGSIVLAITTGQGGSRVKTASGEDGNVIDRDDDRYWKLGQFYFNKNDPAFFLEKRFGIGWTINFAHPVAWLILLAAIAGVILIPLLLGV